MSQHETPGDLIDAIFSAPLDPRCWPHVIEGGSRHVGATAGLLIGDGPGATTVHVIAAYGLDETAVREHEARGLHDDVMVRATLGREAGEVLRSSDVMPPRRFARTDLATRLLEPHGLRHVIGCALRTDVGAYAAIWMYRGDDTGGRFEGDEVARVGRLASHVRQALDIASRLATAQRGAEAARAALDRLAIGSVMVDCQGRPLASNRMAELIAEDDDGFSIQDGGPAGATSNATAELRAAIRATVRNPATVPATGHAVRLERPSHARPYEVIVMPLSPRRMSGGSQAAAVVFVTDPDAAPPRTARLLGELYGLTPAESRLAFALLEGADLSTTASGLGVSRNTAQSQLASIFRKTGTSRQSELVQLVARGAAAVRSVEDSSGFWPAVVDGEAGAPSTP